MRPMRRGLVVAAVVATCLPASAIAANAPGVPVHATLRGSVVVPTKGSPSGSGRIVIRLNGKTGKACWAITTKRIGGALSTHVHRGLPGKTGRVVIPLGDTYHARGCVMLPKNVINAVAANPGRYYVDLHTRAYLNGALRGQLHKGP